MLCNKLVNFSARTLILFSVMFSSAAPALGGLTPGYTWDGSNGDWTDVTHWSPTPPAGGPAKGDIVNINAGTVTITTPVEALTLYFSGGSLSFTNGSLTVYSLFQWTGGTITGTNPQNDSISIPVGSACQANGLSATSTMVQFLISGDMAVSTSSSISDLTLSAGTLTLSSESTLTVPNIMRWTGGEIFGNSGETLQIPAGGLIFGLSGSNLSIDAVTLDIYGNAAFQIFNGAGLFVQNGATIQTEAGGTFDCQSDFNINNDQGSGYVVNLGTFSKSTGTGVNSIFARFNNSGTIDIASGAVFIMNGGSIQTGSIITGSGDLVIASAVNADGPCTLNGNIELAAGGVTHAAQTWNITGTGSFKWTGGKMLDPFATTLSNTNVLNIVPSTDIALDKGHILNLNGSGTYFNNGGKMLVKSNSVLNILSGAILNCQNSTVISEEESLGTINVNSGGTLVNSGGGTLFITAVVNNAGTIKAQNGLVQLYGGGTHSGTFDTDTLSANNISFQNGNHILAAGSQLIGAGYSSIDGAALTCTASINAQNFTMTSGTLDNAFTFTINGFFSWNGGNIVNTGTTSVASGDIHAFSDVALDRGQTLNLLGSMTYSNYSGNLYLKNNSVFNIMNGAVLDCQYGLTIGTSGLGTININLGGTLQKSNTNTMPVYAVVNNAGTVKTADGSIQIIAGGSHSGVFDTGSLPGNEITFDNGYDDFAAGCVWQGAGVVALTGAAATFNGDLNAENVTMTFGSLDNAYAFSISGFLHWTGGTIFNSGSTSIAGTGMIFGSAGPALDGGQTMNVNGSCIYNTDPGVSLNIANSAQLTIGTGAVFDWQTDNPITHTAGSATLANNGTLIKSAGSNTSVIETYFENSGIVDVQTGTVQVANRGDFQANSELAEGHLLISSATTFTSNFTIQSGTLELTHGGILSDSEGCTFNGGGILLLTGGTVIGGGTTTIGSSNSLMIDTTNDDVTIDGGSRLQIENYASFVSNGGGKFLLQRGSILAVDSDATFELLDGGTITTTVGALGAVNNYSGGIVRKPGISTAFSLVPTGALQSSLIATAYNSDGQTQCQTGTIQLTGGGTDTGNFDAASGAEIRFDGGTHVMNAASWTNSGTFTISSGVVSLLDNLNVTNVNFSGGQLDGSGGSLRNATTPVFLSTGTVNWTSGDVIMTVMQMANTLNLTPSITVGLDQGSTLEIQDAANANYDSSLGSLDIRGASNLVVDSNPDGGGFFLNNDGGISSSDSSGSINNMGTFENNSGINTIEPTYTTTGNTFCNSGTLAFAQPVYQNGGLTVLQGGNLSTPVFNLSSGIVSGQGTITGNVFNGGSIDMGQEIGAPPGTLNIVGSYVQNKGGASGSLSIRVGGTNPGDFDVLNVTGTATIMGTLRTDPVLEFPPAQTDTFTVLNSTGVLSGTFDQEVDNGAKFLPQYNPNSVMLTVLPQPGIVNYLQTSGEVGSPFSFNIIASGAAVLDYSASPLPPGLSTNGNMIVGIPTTPVNTFSTTITANNGFGTDSKVLQIFIKPQPPAITSPLNVTTVVGDQFTYSVVASGTQPIYTGADSRTFPDWLSIDEGGTLNGTPTAPGIFMISINADNTGIAGGAIDDQTLTITVLPVQITNTLSAKGTAGIPFSFTLTADGPSPVFSAQNLPSGLSLDSATGNITGTPTLAGNFSVPITATNTLGGDFTNLTILIVPGQIGHFTLTGPASATAGVATNITVAAFDAFSNAILDYSGTVVFGSSDAQAILPAIYTFQPADNGVHVFSMTLGTSGAQTVSTKDQTVATATGSFTIQVSASVAANLKVSGFPSTVNAGTVNQVTVTAVDIFGNTATGYTGTVAITSTDPAAVLPANYTFAATDLGVHALNVTLKTTGVRSLTATDTVLSFSATQSGITVTPAAGGSYVISGYPVSAIAGSANSFSVSVKDIFGNLATNYTGTIHFTSSDALAVLPADYQFTAADLGVKSFTASLKTAGTQSISGNDTSASNVTGTQSGIVVTPANAISLLVAGLPSPAIIGIPGTFIVTAKDTFNNTATGYAGTVHFTSTDAAAILPVDSTFTSADNGVKSFAAILNTVGIQSIAATDTVAAGIKGAQTGIVVNPSGAAFPSVGPIVASLNPAPTGSNIDFSVTASDPNNLPLQFAWDFGDGVAITSGSTASHSYANGGTFTVTCVATNSFAINSATLVMSIYSPASGGTNVPNISQNDSNATVTDPTTNLSITVLYSNGGVIELGIDVSKLRDAVTVNTDFAGISSVSGTHPVQKFDTSGLFVATTTAVDPVLNIIKGKGRKTINIGRKETGQPPLVKVPIADGRVFGITTTKMTGKFNLTGTGLDGIGASLERAATIPDVVTLTGLIELPEGLDISQGVPVSVGIGNIVDDVNVDSRGRGTTKGSKGRIKSIQIKYPKLPNGTKLTGAGQKAKIAITMQTAGMVNAGFDTEGVTKTPVTKALNIQLDMLVAGVPYELSVPVKLAVTPNGNIASISSTGTAGN